MASQSLYTAIDPVSRRNQTAGRRSAHAVPLTVHASLQDSPDQRKTAILLLYGLLDEQQPRLFAQAGIHPPGNSQTLVRLLHNLGDSLRVNH